ncbi:Bug family tripartite tricarboxylate transporter substrate binding protein [Caenimonas soli]|uniref:Bug family tripartite tricarboxylate transporter substrate binding protein n=1 Tax=Caenimonas soli TaxID=2735555 RepID=UPI001554DD0E|nr:tripartite tricarboxylate transporter substrate binding protein [Caenimonas soli]NPC57750.1 tripartite tricarboxylate transporter substrate binding protein [Caenimonas soli]
MNWTTILSATKRKPLVSSLACIAGAMLFVSPASANEWPKQPVKLVVPFSAGGATDLLGRALANELGKIWKQSVVVDNRPGAGGALGAEIVSKSPSDGYTLLLASGSMFTVNQFIYPKLSYTLQNFDLITKVASGPMVITVNGNVPAKNVQELVSHVKANPGKVNFASAGNGSQVHMAGEAFADASGIDIVHIAYKGEGPAYADLLAGTVQMAVGNINAITPLLKTGKIRALAVTGKERAALLPDVPTATEAGLPFEFTGWFALAAPAGTPKELIAKMYADVQQAMQQPGMKRYLADQGMSATISAPGKLGEDILKEAARWKVLVEKRKISAG